jgi:hypothetical protein
MNLRTIRVVAMGALPVLLACGGNRIVYETIPVEAGSPDAEATPDVVAQDTQGPVDSGALPPSVHSSSFSPVQGVLDNGQPAGELYWDYRVDHGQPHVSGVDPNQTFQFQDQIDTVRQATMTETLTGSISGSATGTTSLVVTQQIDPTTGANLSGSSDLTTVLDTGSLSVDEMISNTPPLPGFFDRTDLDTLAIGYSESAMAATSVTGSTTTNGATQTFKGSGSYSVQWTLRDKLPSYSVLGVAYADVVKVEVDLTTTLLLTSSTGQTSSATILTTTYNWLARGVGSIYSESTQQQPGMPGDSEVLELAATNLVPAAAGDAGVADAGLDAGGNLEAGDAGSE